MRAVAVVGKNFGDEGKGMAVDFLALHSESPLVVKHNGGAQAGHTVEYKENGKRFIFHELSAASFRGVDTLWSDTFYPDLYKLSEEIESFYGCFGFRPNIYAAENTCITITDDVLLNMALEASRGDSRHGSCGMGINECDLRTGAGCGLSLYSVSRMSASELYSSLLRIRTEYLPKRLKKIGGELKQEANEYLRLLSNENVLKNTAAAICGSLRYVKILSEYALKKKLENTGTLIFESGQGLLLDRNNEEYAPHVTASDTGLKNPCSFLKRFGYSLDEALFVTRSYVTRHGEGKLPNECCKELLGNVERDKTNEPNPWQGRIRYAPHKDEKSFVSEVRRDLKRNNTNADCSLLLTHLNETNGCIITEKNRIPVEAFIRLPIIRETFGGFYSSYSHFGDDVKEISV